MDSKTVLSGKVTSMGSLEIAELCHSRTVGTDHEQMRHALMSFLDG